MKNKSYRTNTLSSINFILNQESVNYSKPNHPSTRMSIQNLDKKTDLEQIVDYGLENISKLKRLLENTCTPHILTYAEARIVTCQQINDIDRKSCLEIIRNHPNYIKKN